MRSRQLTILYCSVLLWLLLGCVHHDVERFERWYGLQPEPSKAEIERFRSQYPDTPVTTTQPATWNKLEIGMTRGMIRALVGERLIEKGRYMAILRQDHIPIFKERHVRLYFEPRGHRENDVLVAVIARYITNRLPHSTDWP